MIAVRPPEYWPRLAYLALMDRVDRFVLADTFQYSRQSFQNRARLRTPQGWQWISVPLGGGQHGRPVCEVVVEGRPHWIGAHWRSFVYNYHSTPFFAFYEEHFRTIFDLEWATLGDLSCATVALLARLLGLKTELVRSSSLPGRPDTLPGIVQAEGGGPLLSPAEAARYDAAQVGPVSVFRYDEPSYRQNFDGFQPGVSGVDLLLNYGPGALGVLRKGVRVEEAPGR